MKKGISIWSFANPSLEQAFSLAKKSGFDGVEVALAEDGEISLHATKEDMERIKQLANKYKIQLFSLASGLYWDYSFTSNHPETREKAVSIAKKQLQLAAWLGCESILIIPGQVSSIVSSTDEIVPYDVAYQRAQSEISKLIPLAEELEVEIGMENVWNNFLLSPLETRDFAKSFNSPFVKVYFDVGNVVVTGHPEHWISILREQICKIHFKDYRCTAPGLGGFVDLLAGDVNFPAVMDALHEIEYDGWITAEMLPPYQFYPEKIIENTSNALDAILGRSS